MSEANIPQAHINDLIGASQTANPSASLTSSAKASPADSFIKLLSKYALKAANTTGSLIGKAQIPFTAGQATVADADKLMNQVLSMDTNAQTSPLLMGQSKNLGEAGMDMAGMAMPFMGGVQALGEGEGEFPIEDAQAAAEGDAALSNGAEGVRDMRYKQGNFQTKSVTNPLEVADNGGPVREPVPMNPEPQSAPTAEVSPVKPTIPGAVNPKGRTFDVTADIADKENIAQNTQRNKYIQYDAKGISNPTERAQVNATLNGYGITGSFDEQLQGIADKKGELSQAAASQVAADGGFTPRSTLEEQAIHDVAYSGASRQIPNHEVPQAVNKYLNDVYVRATGGDPTKVLGNMLPDNIPDTTVQRMKSIMGEDAAGTFGKDPTTWTPSQQVARITRNSFDATLDKAHPEASILNNDTNDLYKAQEGITSGANKEAVKAADLINSPKQTGLGKIGSLVGNVMNSKLGLATLGLGGIALYDSQAKGLSPSVVSPTGLPPINSQPTGLPSIANGTGAVNSTPQNLTNANNNANNEVGTNPGNNPVNNPTNNFHNGIIGSNTPDVKSFPTSADKVDLSQPIPNVFAFKDSSGNPMFKSTTQYETDKQNINNMKNDPRYGTVNQYTNMVNTLSANNESQHNNTQPIEDSLNVLNNTESQVQSMKDLLLKTQPNLPDMFTIPGTDIGGRGMHENMDKNFGTLIGLAKQLDKAWGTDIASSTTGESMLEKMNQLLKTARYSYLRGVQSKLGSQATLPSVNPNPTGLPSVPSLSGNQGSSFKAMPVNPLLQ